MRFRSAEYRPSWAVTILLYQRWLGAVENETVAVTPNPVRVKLSRKPMNTPCKRGEYTDGSSE